jgi:hypothetical protein
MEDFFKIAMDNIEGPEDSTGAEAFVALHNAGEYLTKGKESFDNNLLETTEGLKKFKDDHHPSRITELGWRSSRTQNIEGVFGRLEGRADQIDTYQKVLKMVGWLLWKLNNKCEKDLLSSPYRLLVEAIGQSGAKTQHRHTFISFNYDIWLEQALFKYDPHLWHPKWGYGFDPMYYVPPETLQVAADNGGEIHPSILPTKRNPLGPVVLKPHGSLSWYHDPADTYAPVILSCTNSRELTFAPGGNELCNLRLPLEGTQYPSRSYWPYIVPPTPLKTRSGPIFWKIQKQMENALANADVVVIIGWSMPDTDKDVRGFIERTIQSRTNQLRKVVCCDKRKGSFFKRFEQLFWPAESPTNYDGGFDKHFIDQVFNPILTRR